MVVGHRVAVSQFSDHSVGLRTAKFENISQKLSDLIFFESAVFVGVEIVKNDFELVDENASKSLSRTQAFILPQENLILSFTFGPIRSRGFAGTVSTKVVFQEGEVERVTDVCTSA